MFYEIFYGNRNLITPPKHGLGLLAERSVAMPVVLKRKDIDCPPIVKRIGGLLKRKHIDCLKVDIGFGAGFSLWGWGF